MSSRGTVTTRALPGSPFNQPPAVAIVARIGYWLTILIGTVQRDDHITGRPPAIAVSVHCVNRHFVEDK
jgi:hypothetical protein